MTRVRVFLYFMLGLVIMASISLSHAVATWASGDNSVQKTMWCAYPAVVDESDPHCGSFDTAAIGACAAPRNGGNFTVVWPVTQTQFTGSVSCGGNVGSSSEGLCIGHSPLRACPDGVEQPVRYRSCHWGTAAGTWSVYGAGSSVCPTNPDIPPDPCASKAGQPDGGNGYYLLGTDASGSFPNVACSSGCEVTFSGGCPSTVALVAGVPNYYCLGGYGFTGGSCTTGTGKPAQSSLPPDTCPTGQSVDAGPPKSCSATPPDPCPAGQERVGGSCTPIPCPTGYTRNATTGNCGPTPPEPPDPGDPPPAGGNPGGGAGTPPPDKPPPTTPVPKTYCEEHPTDPMCAPSSFSATCPPTANQCKGDAVQCAQALNAKQLACDYEMNAKAWTELRTTIGSSYTPGNYAESMTIPYDVSKIINTADMDSAGGCPDDIHFDAMGGSFSIPMAPYCTMAGYVKFFLLFAAMVIAMRIFAS